MTDSAGGCGCGCSARHRSVFRVQFAGASRTAVFNGRLHLVLPVVMIREGVLNGALVPVSEFFAEAWNGVPVTVGHPSEDGVHISANSPGVLEREAVGTVFGARVDKDRLVAEVWIDVAKAEARRPGLVASLSAGAAMDVSVGYFHRQEAVSGVFDGRAYSAIDRDLKPDHLALLPDDAGACSWEDGCGVRVHSKGGEAVSQLINVLKEALGLETNLGAGSPAPVPAVKHGGEPMTDAPKGAAAAAPAPDAAPVAPPAQVAAPVPAPDLAAMVSQAVASVLPGAIASALPGLVTKAVDQVVNSGRRADLITRLAAHSGLSADDLAPMSLEALEKLAAKTSPPADFSGRATGAPADGGVKFDGLFQVAGAVPAPAAKGGV